MTPNADGTYTLTWLTGYRELPTHRTVVDLDTGAMRMEQVTPGRHVTEAEFRSGAYRPPVHDDRVMVVEGASRRLMDLRAAATIFARKG